MEEKKSDRQGELTNEQFERLQHLMVMGGDKTWEINGWTVEREKDLKSALSHEVRHQESLIYALRFGDADCSDYTEFVLEDHPELDPEEDDQEIQRLCWEQLDFEVELMWSEWHGAKNDEDVMDVACLFWHQIKVTHVECQRGYCSEMVCVETGFECPSCNEFFCEEDTPSEKDLECQNCGHEIVGVEAMRLALKDAGKEVR